MKIFNNNDSNSMDVKYFITTYDDEDAVLNAAKTCRQRGLRVYDVFTPYYVHELDEVLQVPRTRLLWIGAFAGLVGLILGVALQVWTSAHDWPLVVGGKPFNSFPAFIPVTFELTVLFSGLIGIGALFIRNRMWPLSRRHVFEGVSNDKFVLVVEQRDASVDERDIRAALELFQPVKIEEASELP